MGDRRQMSKKPSRDVMEAAIKQARLGSPTKARDWMRAIGYSLSREDEERLFYAAANSQTYHCTRKGWRVLADDDPALALLPGKVSSLSGALTMLRGMKISVPRSHEHIIMAIIVPEPSQAPLHLVEAAKPVADAVKASPDATADTILAAVRLATGKATKADIAAVAKAIGADAAIKLLITGA